MDTKKYTTKIPKKTFLKENGKLIEYTPSKIYFLGGYQDKKYEGLGYVMYDNALRPLYTKSGLLIKNKKFAGEDIPINNRKETISILKTRLKHQQNEVKEAKKKLGMPGYTQSYLKRMQGNVEQTKKLIKKYE